ncbi:MAG TPA: HepT-like ribonuclease domain-containing protein [Candidatus Xenobia bacterium]|jgi:uncharacterized protein YutE (UPF0331/DUF86 family)
MTVLQEADWPGIARRLDLDFVVLHGSQAKNRARRNSDVDLAVMPTGHGDPDDVGARLMGELGTGNIDLTWLPNASWLLAWQVSEGQLLHERQRGAYHAWQLYAWQRYADSECWRRLDRAFFNRYVLGAWALDKALLQRKLNAMVPYLRDLEAHLPPTAHEFEADPYAVERLLQLLVDAAVAINTEVAQSVAQIPPSDDDSSFYSMIRCRWIDDEIAHALAPLAGLRNRLVHQYEDVDLAQTWQKTQASLPYWHRYLKSVSAHL